LTNNALFSSFLWSFNLLIVFVFVVVGPPHIFYNIMKIVSFWTTLWIWFRCLHIPLLRLPRFEGAIRRYLSQFHLSLKQSFGGTFPSTCFPHSLPVVGCCLGLTL
jgi:hypothetical protein